MWKVTNHKCGSQYLELKVAAMLKEMAGYSFLSYAEAFIHRFHENLEAMPIFNGYEASHMYRAEEVSTHSVEIWKMTLSGDFKYKMFTLDFIKE